MAVTHKRYEVGEKLYHEDYGEGMVVEVRPRPFFDILEVAFADGVRRLNSNHPKVTDRPIGKGDSRPPALVPSARRPVAVRHPGQKRAPGARPARSTKGARAVAEASNGSELELQAGAALVGPEGQETAVPVEPMASEAGAPGFGFADGDGLWLDPASIEEILSIAQTPKDEGQSFLFHLQGERLSLTRGFRSLLALSAVRDLERYDFQIQACLRVLRKMRGRAVLADEVGLGKTIEAGLILKEYVMRGLVRKALVLTPVSLMSQWQEELQHKFDLPFEIRARGQGWADHPFFIASIDTAKTERNREEIGAAGFDLLVVDEAHRLRNHLTQGWKFVDALSLKYLLLLTATPVQNDLRELYNLVTLLRPGLLGTYRSFRKQFMVRGDKRLPKNTRDLASTLSKVMVRTSRSSTALTFPKREVQIVPFEMSEEERRLYDGVSEFVREVVEEKEKNDFPRWHFLLMILQKEMGSSTYAAVKTLERSRRIFREKSWGHRLSGLIDLGHAVKVHAKAEGLKEMLRREKDEKVIVFTQFRRTLEFLERELKAEGQDVVVFHGSLSPRDKDRAVQAFKGDARILLSTEAGGEGRNLQFARMVVNYDLPWNPMKIEQRIGRVHRLGQTRDTFIWNFTTRETVEDYVLAILHRKIHMFELVIGEMDMVLGHWSDRESFENEVFRIWTRHRGSAERQQAFEELGESLAVARQRHERVKDFDEAIFSRMEIASSTGDAEEVVA